MNIKALAKDAAFVLAVIAAAKLLKGVVPLPSQVTNLLP